MFSESVEMPSETDYHLHNSKDRLIVTANAISEQYQINIKGYCLCKRQLPMNHSKSQN